MLQEILVPANKHGKSNDLVYTTTLDTKEKALDCFKRACMRLINPHIWHDLCGDVSATITLTDEHGTEVKRLAEVNDHYRINLPGPGTIAGNGYDWVQVKLIQDNSGPEKEEESFGIKVCPAPNPLKDVGDVAHFLQSDASSSFLIRRYGHTVISSYHGRNEIPNAKTKNVLDNVRNTVVAAGAFAGLSEAYWNTLIKAFLEAEIGG